MKRFYDNVRVDAEAEGYVLFLDQHRVKTPAQAVVHLPTQTLARAVAREWDAQGDTIKPDAMPLMKLVATAIDHITPNHRAGVQAFVNYGLSDLLCYRASHPDNLVARQNALWTPLLDWAAQNFAITLTTTQGLTATPLPADIAQKLAAAAGQAAFRLAGLAHGSQLLGSAVIALALAEGHIDAPRAYDAAFLDELFQMEQWGYDDDAKARLDKIRLEIDGLAGYFSALNE